MCSMATWACSAGLLPSISDRCQICPVLRQDQCQDFHFVLDTAETKVVNINVHFEGHDQPSMQL
jgi:hypothetical protein